MEIRALPPSGKREWTFFALGAAAAVVVLALVTSRYEYRNVAGSDYLPPGIMRIDHWTGSMDRCVVSCLPVRDKTERQAPAAAP
jgi:hypothetical protein